MTTPDVGNTTHPSKYRSRNSTASATALTGVSRQLRRSETHAIRHARQVRLPYYDLVYDLAAGSFYAVNGEAVINATEGQPFAGAHSDIRDPAIGQLIASAAAAHT